MKDSYLFFSISVFDVAEAAKARLQEAVQELDQAELGDESLAERLTQPLVPVLPVLQEEQITAEPPREVQIDVSGDPYRLVLDRSRPVYIAGTEIVISVPFQGDGEAFAIRPAQHTLNPPVGEVVGHELRFTYRTANPDAPIRAEFDRTLAQIKQHLGSLGASLDQMRDGLRRSATALIAERRRRIDGQRDLVGGLGLPVRPVAQARDEAPRRETRSRSRGAAAAERRTTGPGDRWDVFICHASEDKAEVARPLAQALEAKGMRVWFDELSLRIGDSLRQAVDNGLARSQFGIVVLSAHFFGKHWPKQELNGLGTREVDGKKVILPVWHRVDEDEVRRFSPMLADRVAARMDAGLEKVVEAIAAATDWPTEPPRPAPPAAPNAWRAASASRS